MTLDRRRDWRSPSREVRWAAWRHDLGEEPGGNKARPSPSRPRMSCVVILSCGWRPRP